MRHVVILGAGGFAREVADIFEACKSHGDDVDVLGYVVETPYFEIGIVINDLPLLGDFRWLQNRASEVEAICAVGAPEVRMRLVQQALDLGVGFCSAIHPTATITPRVRIGRGVVVGAGCIFTNNIVVGDHAHINLDCTVGHDVVIKSLVTISPGVHISGNVTIETGSYVGTGANVIEKTAIGHWSVVGAGTTVVKDVPPNTTVVGVPGKVIKERPEGWHLRQAGA